MQYFVDHNEPYLSPSIVNDVCNVNKQSMCVEVLLNFIALALQKPQKGILAIPTIGVVFCNRLTLSETSLQP